MKNFDILEALRCGSDQLKGVAGDRSHNEARLLLSKITGLSAIEIITSNRQLENYEQDHYMDFVKRRASGYPVAYLVGEKEFFGRSFKVTPDVLIPRPETEYLIEKSLDFLNANSARPLKMIELGVGSGCISITLDLEYKGMLEVIGLEKSSQALKVAHENADRLGAMRVQFQEADFLNTNGAGFDLIVTNPPYLPSDLLLKPDIVNEPKLALEGGQEGWETPKKILEIWMPRLNPGGQLLMETHDQNQREQLRKSVDHFKIRSDDFVLIGNYSG